MQKTLYYSLLAVLLFTITTACDSNNENEYIDIPRQPQHDEIKMIFNATSENPEAFFYFVSDNGIIDWGDGHKSTARDVDSNKRLHHQYEKNREYVITITVNEDIITFRNFSGGGLSDFKEESICLYEEIKIGSAVKIQELYLQSSGVKKISTEGRQSIDRVNLLLGDEQWNFSMIDAKSLSIYAIYNNDLDIKELTAGHLSIIVKDKINYVSVTSCDNLETLSLSTKVFSKATINNLLVNRLPKLNDLRLYALAGRDAKFTDLPQLELVILNAVDYETIDMTNSQQSSVEMSLKAEGISVSKSLKLSKQLATLYIDNRKFDLKDDIQKIDLSICTELKQVDIYNLNSLHNLNFSRNNKRLESLILKYVSSLNSLDFGECKNIEYVEVEYADILSNVKFSVNNELLRDAKFQYANFTEASCIDMINTLPNFPIPNIPTVNRRRLSIRNNTPSLKDNQEVMEAIKGVHPNWVSFVE